MVLVVNVRHANQSFRLTTIIWSVFYLITRAWARSVSHYANIIQAVSCVSCICGGIFENSVINISVSFNAVFLLLATLSVDVTNWQRSKFLVKNVDIKWTTGCCQI